MGEAKLVKAKLLPKLDCPVPDCRAKVMMNSKYGFCYSHESMMTFFLWAIPRILLKEKPKDDKIWTPNQ